MALAFASHLRDTSQSLDLTLRRAKFAIPSPPAMFVPRDTLVDRLEALITASDNGVTAVSAPVGSGKSTLVASLARKRTPGSTAWCTLDADDNDPHEFAVSILEAILASRSSDGVGRAANAGHSASGVLDEALLIAAYGDPLMLVLDECEHIRVDAKHATIGRLLRQAPPNLSVVLVTDHDVRLSMRGFDQVESLRDADLAFTVDEMAEMFEHERLAISDDGLLNLASWTEGRATAVAFAVTAYRDARDRERVVAAALRAESSAHVSLFERVLERLSDDQRVVLVTSSIVDVICGELAAALTGTDDAGAALHELVRTGMFYDAIPGAAGWYRHRHPTRELLTAELRHERRDEIEALYGCAAHWFASAGYPQRALDSAIKGREWNLVLDLVRERWIAASLDELSPGLNGVPRVPDGVEGSADVALVASAIDIEHAQLELAQQRLEEVDGPDSDLFDALLRLRLARDTTDAAGIDRAAEVLFKWCTANDGSHWMPDAECLAWRAQAEARLIEGDLVAAAVLLERVCTEGVVHGLERQVANATASLAVVTAASGRVRRAEALVDELGDAWFSGTDFSRGVRATARAICAYHADNVALAQVAASEARNALRPSVYRDVILTMVRARISLSVGDDASACRLLHRAQGVGADVLYATISDALGLSVDESAPGPLLPHPYAVARQRLDEAVRCYEDGRPVDAWVALEHVLTLAERNSYRRILLDSRHEVRPLLVDYIAQARPFTQIAWQLLQRLPDERAEGETQLVESLTERELAVLRLLPTMKSNREIAAEMYFSVNTVKTHLKSIYRKLGVNRRRAAVEVARAHSLL
jgi:LuxR family maltose regulon positive regulatory protein